MTFNERKSDSSAGSYWSAAAISSGRERELGEKLRGHRLDEVDEDNDKEQASEEELRAA